MYNGNMQDFCTKVDSYIKRKYDCNIVFGKRFDGTFYVGFFTPDSIVTEGYNVFDREDFEQQIYDFVNEELKYVQEEYDGFSEQPDDLFGEEI